LGDLRARKDKNSFWSFVVLLVFAGASVSLVTVLSTGNGYERDARTSGGFIYFLKLKFGRLKSKEKTRIPSGLLLFYWFSLAQTSRL